jgi:hypothetical protein
MTWGSKPNQKSNQTDKRKRRFRRIRRALRSHRAKRTAPKPFGDKDLGALLQRILHECVRPARPDMR